MNMLDRAVLYVGVPLAVILAAVGISSVKDIQSEMLKIKTGGLGKGLAAPAQTVNIEKQTGPVALNCYADLAWVPVTSGGDTFYWVNQMAMDVNITFTTQALRDGQSNPVNSPVVLKAAGAPGSTMGPYHVDPGTISMCQDGNADSCYLSYDIKVGNNSCEDHGVNYFTGIQITR